MNTTDIDNVTLHSAQPFHAFVEVYVAGQVLRSEFSDRREKSRAPEYIQSFEFQRIKNGTGSFILTMFDKNWTELETTFNIGFKHIDIRYGYVTGKQSAMIKCVATDYNIRFTMSGTIITLSGITKSVHKNLDLISVKTGSTNPASAAKAVCQAAGFKIGTFEDTLDVDVPNGFDVLKEHPVAYINQRLAPYALRKADGLGGYRLILDDTTSPPTAHFMPLSAQKKSDHVYIFGRGINSSVVSLDISVEGKFGGTGINGSTTNVETSTLDSATEDTSDATGNTTESNVESKSSETEEYTNTSSDQSDVVSTEGLSPEQASAVVTNSMSLSGSVPYKGSMTILGDPTIDIKDVIELAVLTASGEIYTTISGKYTVMGVRDSISNGKFLTTIQLQKGSAGTGSDKKNGNGSSSGGSEPSRSNDSSGDGKGSLTKDYSPNNSISNVAVRIYVPSGSGTGHFELVVTGGTSVFKNRKYDKLVLSFGGGGKVTASPDSHKQSRGGTKYLWNINVSNFANAIKKIESFTPGKESRAATNRYGYKSKVNYSLNKYNCFWFVAQTLKQMGFNTLWDIYSKAGSYKEYTAKPMYKKYGSAWKKE